MEGQCVCYNLITLYRSPDVWFFCKINLKYGVVWWEKKERYIFYIFASSLGQAHASVYRRSVAVSSTTICYSAYVVILGVYLRFKPHWIFQIYKYVIKGRDELTSCSSLVHSYLFPLLDVLFWTERCAKFVKAASNHIVAAIQGAGNTMPLTWDSELIYLSDLTYQRQHTSKLCSQPALKRFLIGRSSDTRHSRYPAI